MTLNVCLAGLVLFSVCVLTHIFYWQHHTPRNQMLALLLIFIAIPILTAPLMSAAGFPRMILLAVYVMHFCLTGVYLVTYPAVQAYSPSLQIILLLSKAGSIGLTHEEIISSFESSKIVSNKFHDLVHTGFLAGKGDKYQLTFIARNVLMIYSAFRSILGLSIKGK